MTIRNPRLLLRGEREQALLNRMVSRTLLNDTRPAAVVRSLIAAVAASHENLSFKIISLLDLYSLDFSTGADLDERAVDIGAVTDGNLPPREQGRRSQGNLLFSRPGTSGTVTIPAGTRVQRVGGGTIVVAVTTADGAINVGSTSSGLIPALTEQYGQYTESDPSTFEKLISRIPGVSSVTNPGSFSGGTDEEKDEDFRQRIKNYIRSLALSTPAAIEKLAQTIELESGQRVIAARAIERDDKPGRGTLYIDDGSGTVDVGQVNPASNETVLSSATGGELRLQLGRFPVVDTESLEIRINGALLVRNEDYALMPGTGAFRLLEGSYPTGLVNGDVVTASYSYYTGLIAETQWRVDGRADDTTNYPGWRGFGAFILVKAPTPVFLTVDAVLTMKSGYLRSTAVMRAKGAVSRYVNRLNMGEDPVLNEIVCRMMDVPGVLDVTLNSPTSNIAIPDTSVARIKDAGLLIQ